VSLIVFIQRNFVADLITSSEVRFYTENSRFAFLSPLWRLRPRRRAMFILGSLESA